MLTNTLLFNWAFEHTQMLTPTKHLYAWHSSLHILLHQEKTKYITLWRVRIILLVTTCLYITTTQGTIILALNIKPTPLCSTRPTRTTRPPVWRMAGHKVEDIHKKWHYMKLCSDSELLPSFLSHKYVLVMRCVTFLLCVHIYKSLSEQGVLKNTKACE